MQFDPIIASAEESTAQLRQALELAEGWQKACAEARQQLADVMRIAQEATAAWQAERQARLNAEARLALLTGVKAT